MDREQSNTELLIEIDNLVIDFRTASGDLHAVRGISLQLFQDEILGIIGESGSGKSVTAKAILKLLPANAIYRQGEVRYRGEPLMHAPPARWQQIRGGEIGMIFQEPGRSFDPIQSIKHVLAETILAHAPQLNEMQIRQRSLALLEEVRVPNPADRLRNFPHQFSGGLLQRIMIALALAANPRILIADEPTTALDVTTQAEIIALLLRLKQERGLSIIFITHNLALIAAIANRIAVVYGGLIMEIGTPEAVIYRPRHPYSSALANSIPALGRLSSHQRLQAIPGVVANPLHSEPGCPFEPRCPQATEQCRRAIPPLRTEETQSRCLYPGIKTWTTATVGNNKHG